MENPIDEWLWSTAQRPGARGSNTVVWGLVMGIIIRSLESVREGRVFPGTGGARLFRTRGPLVHIVRSLMDVGLPAVFGMRRVRCPRTAGVMDVRRNGASISVRR
jgi:hypothetical protein